MGPYFRAASQEELLNFVATLSKTAPRDRSIGVEYVEDQRPGKGDHFWRTVFVQEPPGITGEHVAHARTEKDDSGWYVQVDLTAQGAKLFAEFTGKHVDEYLAIMRDRRAYSVPVIREQISGGLIRITLGAEKKPAETLREAKELVSVLNAHSSDYPQPRIPR
jgi:preprotein translocase subunit SecD